MKALKYLSLASIMTLAACMTSCSSDDDNNNDNNPTPNPEPTVEYKWGEDGGLKSCDHILFSEVDNSEKADGAQIGNGDAEFVFTGKQTLKKGTYILKGWVYIGDGAELTIEPGTVI